MDYNQLKAGFEFSFIMVKKQSEIIALLSAILKKSGFEKLSQSEKEEIISNCMKEFPNKLSKNYANHLDKLLSDILQE